MNLIIHNLPETDDNATSVTEMIVNEFKLKVKINKATRLGRINENPAKPRLLKIEMENQKNRQLEEEIRHREE